VGQGERDYLRAMVEELRAKHVEELKSLEAEMQDQRQQHHNTAKEAMENDPLKVMRYYCAINISRACCPHPNLLYSNMGIGRSNWFSMYKRELI